MLIHFPVWKCKHFELQICMFKTLPWLNLELSTQFRTKQDHAGFHFNVSISKFFMEINLYDVRHYDIENDKWIGTC